MLSLACSAFAIEIDLSSMSVDELKDLQYRIGVELKSRDGDAQDIVIRKDARLTYKKSFLIEKDGISYLLVEFEFTNMKSFSTDAAPTWMQCYQDGFKLKGARSSLFPEYQFDTPDVRPNVSYTFYRAYELRNDSPVELVDDSIDSDTVITISVK